jgi:ribosomal protein L11 methylase PrmA
MAEQLGETETVLRWNRLYQRLRLGILHNLVDHSEFGYIWHTEANCNWQDHAHKMLHIQLASDGFTYTPLQDYSMDDEIEKKYMEIDLNTYRYLMKDKNYNCLRMYGYGQGIMAQSALLLDEMKDAAEFIKMLLKHCYLPKFARWASPEGIILHKSGKYYLPVNGIWGRIVMLPIAPRLCG